MEVSYLLHAPDLLLPSPKQIPRLLARAQMSSKAGLELVLKKYNHFPSKEYNTESPA
jgi:hypothetical protein